MGIIINDCIQLFVITPCCYITACVIQICMALEIATMVCVQYILYGKSKSKEKCANITAKALSTTPDIVSATLHLLYQSRVVEAPQVLLNSDSYRPKLLLDDI